MKGASARIGVIGSGVSGLTCALTLAREGYDVIIHTRDLPESTTSAVAAAVWYPLRGERDARCDRWLPRSFERFCALAGDPGTGVMLRGGVELFREPVDDSWWCDVLPGFRHARADELPPGFVDGFIAEGIPLIEMPVYLRWLRARAEIAGARIVQRSVGSLDEVLDEHEIIVNCAGLGARELVPDPSMTPVRGQVVRVAPFGLDRYILDETDPDGIVYVYPRSRDVVIGGTREIGDESLEPRPGTTRALLERAAVLAPRVLDSPVLSHGVGIRPGRSSVRVEAEERDGRFVVHDYGHGGSGVTLSWGCALDVLELVRSAGV